MRGEDNMTWQENNTKVEDGGEDYKEFERDFQQFFDFEGVFFFLLGILGGVLVVVLGLILVQQGKVNKREQDGRNISPGVKTDHTIEFYFVSISSNSKIKNMLCLCSDWLELCL